MSITYTNRKGVLYYLCRSAVRTGKLPYYFAREPKGDPVDLVPPGYKISETVNGQVYLEPDRPGPIRPAEIAVVEEAIGRLPKPHFYRVRAREKRIEVYERVGADVDEMMGAFGLIGITLRTMDAAERSDIEAMLDRQADYDPVMRFVLVDAEARTFRAERMGYTGQGGWRKLWGQGTGPLADLVDQLIPTLGTEDFFTLY
jgi:hypothetical protein